MPFMGGRNRRFLLLGAKALAIILLAVTNRSLLAPAGFVHRSQESKRPKVPKSVVRAEPIRISADEKQGSEHRTRSHADEGLEAGVAPSHRIGLLPGHARVRLTQPHYLDPFDSTGPHLPFAPPA